MRQKTRLSINLNKVALLRNARGSDFPNLLKVALDCEHFGAEGITIHPRPDQRHARYDDIGVLKSNLKTELNVEGNPIPTFLKAVLDHKPAQCTLVPDAPDALTSTGGWDTIKHESFLKEICDELRKAGIRSSIFLDPDPTMVEGAAKVGADRIELYTHDYAKEYLRNKEKYVSPHAETAILAQEMSLGVNAGHDLNLDNLQYFVRTVPNVLEVSIGHALLVDSIYYGLHNTVQMYLGQLS